MSLNLLLNILRNSSSLDELVKARTLAEELLTKQNVPETSINCYCYDWFRNLATTNRDYAVLCAEVFKEFKWKYWLEVK